MSERDDKMRAAILGAHTTQYAARCVNPDCDHGDQGPAGIFRVGDDPGPVSDFIKMSDRPDLFELVFRRVGTWKRVYE